MRNQNLDREWLFDHGQHSPFLPGGTPSAKTVNLPHDYMIESDTFAEAPAGPASGYYTAGVAHYAKNVLIPAEWANELVFLRMDGVMMNATVEINGCKAVLQHYGYAPFSVDITPYLAFGEENSIRITVNPSMQPNSRWYSGAGIFRSLELVHTPKLHIANDGIFAWTERLEYGSDGRAVRAYLKAQVDIVNACCKNRIADVAVSLIPDGQEEPVITASRSIHTPPIPLT